MPSISPEEFAMARHLRLLIERYEAVRCVPGEDRNRAGQDLGVALARHGPFRHNGIVWAWSYTEKSITRYRAQEVNHPHRNHDPECGETVPQSSRRQCGKNQAFGGWSIKGRSL